MDSDHRLVTYGSLAPGRPNHHHVAALRGRWFAGAVRGRLLEAGWGASLGHPAMVLDPATEGAMSRRAATCSPCPDGSQRPEG